MFGIARQVGVNDTRRERGSGGSDCAWVDYVQSPSPTDWLTITYGYDSAGRRIEKAYDGQTVMKYLYDGGHIIAEYDGTDSLLHKYIYGPGVDQPICMIDVADSNATYYYHFDGLGSVIALTNSAGSVVNLYEYSVYGEVSATDPNHPNRFLFTGREFDADTGLYYYRARYYNPYIARFLQTDPAGDAMNPYVYCGNDPLGAIDPSGSIAVWTIDKETGAHTFVKSIHPRPKNTPRWMISEPKYGKTWTWRQFFWWYVNKNGERLDIETTGLMDAFKEGVHGSVVFLRGNARDIGVKQFWEMDKEDNEWLERARLFRRGEISAEELGDRPPGRVVLPYQDVDSYYFGPGMHMFAFGHGLLHVDATITVDLNIDANTGRHVGGQIYITYVFWFEDWFRDVWDSRNKIPDIAVDGSPRFLEYDDGHPYPFSGSWMLFEKGTWDKYMPHNFWWDTPL